MKLFAKWIGGAVTMVCLLAVQPTAALADRYRDGIRDARNEVRKQEQDLREAIACYNRERREGDRRGARKALANIRAEERAVAEARRELAEQLRYASYRNDGRGEWNRGDHRRRSENQPKHYRPHHQHPVHGYRDRLHPRSYGWRGW